jgi:hypothetical protein
MPLTTQPQDLTTVALVAAWMNITGNAANDIIQGAITAASTMVLQRTGVASLNSLASYTERYDGNGGKRQFVLNPLITAVASVVVGGITLAQSTDYVSPGWVIDQSKKSISLIGPMLNAVGYSSYAIYGLAPAKFPMGNQNVAISYTGGYSDSTTATHAPWDVEQAVTELVAINVSRRGWIDKASLDLKEGGTTTYQRWEMTPSIQGVISRYTRRAIV